MELEPAHTEFQLVDDPRPRLMPPPPVHLVAVNDVNLAAVAGLEMQLDGFYVTLLRFEREYDRLQEGRQLVYRAENFRLRLTLHEAPPRREDFRALGVAVPSLADLAQRASAAGVNFIHQRGLFAGAESLVFSDPAGNIVEATETRLLA